jgi:tellurite resistance protein TerA
MLTLGMGANAPLNMGRFEVVIEWPTSAGTLDSSTYLLAAGGKVRGDADMIFYNQPAGQANSVRITSIEAGRTHIAVDLGAVPAEVERIVMCVTIEEPGRTMAAFGGTCVTVLADGEPQMRFAPDLGTAREVALRLVEFYRRAGAWKIRADGQGFNDGLAPLARSFGINVAADEAAPPREKLEPTPAPSAPRPEPPARAEPSGTPERPPPVASIAPPQAAAGPRHEDGAIALRAGGPPHAWSIGSADHLGAVSARLTWTSQCGGIDGRPRPLELALGCLYELQDGRRGAVQAWDYNGQFDTPPFTQLSPVESGGVDSQKLRINGGQWPRIKRLALYAFIPDGAPSWRSASVSLEISATNREQVLLEPDRGVEGLGMLALVLLENRHDDVSFVPLGRFLPGHHELDRELGWGLAWRIRPRGQR